MNLQEIKDVLESIEILKFQLPNGEFVPPHFHVTEIGAVKKHFIDCGGTVRKENKVNFQLWNANDFDHRLHPEKLIHILELSEEKLGLKNDEIEVEFQGETIQKFGLSFNGEYFLLESTQTDCLAKDNCGIPAEKPKVNLADLQKQTACLPSGNCC